MATAAPPKPERQLVLQTPPAGSVDSVAVSPDGSLVATAAGEGGVRLYDAKTGAFLRTIGGGDRGVVFSPDGRLLTAAGFHMDKLVGVFDVQSGKRVLTLPGQTEWEAYATAVSPDGKLLASTATDKQILVWELPSGKLRLQLKDLKEKLAALAFSPDSATLAGAGGEKLIHLWDTTTGKLRRSVAGHRDWICTLAFSPDGRTIASGSCDWGFHRAHDWPRPPSRGREQCEWRLWDVDSGKLVRTVTEQGQLLSMSFAPDGKSLACGLDQEVRLYDLSSKSAPRVITKHDATITSVAFTPDGSAIISGSHDQTAKRTNLATAKTQWQTPGYFEQINAVALSNDGSLLVTGSCDQRFARSKLPASARELGPGAVRLWDARTGRMLRRLSDPADQIMAVAISADGKRVASGGTNTKGEGVVHVWDAASGDAVWSSSDHVQVVLSVVFAPDGRSLASGAADGVVQIRDAQSGAVVRKLTDHKGGATSLVFSSDSKVLYCGEGFGGARAWNAESGRLLKTCKVGESKAEFFTIDRRITSLGLSRDGATLATCGSSVNNEFVDPVRLWDARSGSLLRDFAAENIHGRPMALSPDGLIVAAGGKSVKLWDVRTGKMLRELTGHLKRTQSIAFSADGRLIFSGGSYGTTNIWEVATGRHLVTLFTFVDHRDGTLTDDWLAYTSDGYYDGSPGVERYIAWRVGDDLATPASIGENLRQPDRITTALQLKDFAADRPLLVPARGSPISVGGSALAAGDVNGDTIDDLLVVAGKHLNVFFGGRAREWRQEPDASTDLESNGSEIKLADVNRDAKLDVVIADHDSYSVAVLLGIGSGRFKAAEGSPFVAREGTQPHTHGLAVADVDGDGDLDIVTANNSDGDVSLLLGDGKGKFVRASSSPFSCGKSPYPIAASDVNGDGCADVLVPNATHGDGSAKTLTILLGGKGGQLKPASGSPLIGDAMLWYAAAGDLNGDKRPDIVAMHGEGHSGATVWLNTGQGKFQSAPGSPLEFGHGAWGVEIADMNLDGSADLVVAADESIRVLLGDGTGRFKSASGSPFKSGKGAWRLVVGDFNGDRRLDVAYRCVEANHLEILVGN
jgi:WD40 repeat protein